MRAPTPPESAAFGATLPALEFDPKATFPSQVHQMISEIDELASHNKTMKQFKKIISWQEHGMAFKIHDREKFIEKVMPRYFSRLKYSSWVRQLNLFGFRRIQMDGNDKGALYHENFIRGMPEMAATITKAKKNNQGQRNNEVEKEPDFQRMVYQRVGMPVTQIFQRGAREEAKAAEMNSPASAPSLASAYMAASHPMMAASDADSSLRDMLLPILHTSDSGVPAQLPPTDHGADHSTNAAGQLDPFENLWNSLGEGIQSTPHYDERLHMNTQLATHTPQNAWDMEVGLGDVEPLRVFHPEHQHGSMEHESEDEDSKIPSYARGA